MTDGFWLFLPVALLVAGAGPRGRIATAGAGGLLLAGALLAPPPWLPAALVAPACVAVVLFVRTRLEVERDTMRHFALRDPLTGLSNRRALDERLGYEIARHSRQHEPFVVLALDLDGFKALNDRFGHDAGDEVLRDVAAALVIAVREQDTVVRLGGDEFCVLAPLTDRAGATLLTSKLLTALEGVTAGVLAVSASAGAAVFPEDGTNATRLLAAADANALAAKRRRRARRAARAA